MTREVIDELIQQAKAEFLNEEVVKESDLETIQEQSYAKGWNACNRRWIKALDESLSRLQIQLCKPKLYKSQESEVEG